jgi:hypothetical protein
MDTAISLQARCIILLLPAASFALKVTVVDAIFRRLWYLTQMKPDDQNQELDVGYETVSTRESQ